MTITPTDSLSCPRTLFINANLVGRPVGSYSVLVEDGKVTSVTEGLVAAPADTTVVDLKQADGQSLWLSPSLVDFHTHFSMNTLASRRLDLFHMTSASQVLEAVRAAVDDPTYDEGGRLVGLNMRSGEWSDGADLNREALDAISSTKPICLVYNGYHSSVSNSACLRWAGIDIGANPGGLLEEGPAFALLVKLQAGADENVLDTWVRGEADRAASLGVTEVVDLEMADNVSEWQRRAAKGFSNLRVHIGFYPPYLENAVAAGYKDGDIIPRTHGLVCVGPFKLISDGSLGSKTAYCTDPYPGTCNHGQLGYEPKDMDSLLGQASAAGLRLAVHAIGDEALRLVLDTLDTQAQAGNPPRAGSTIEHAQLVHLSDLPRMHALGLTASVQPRHLVDDLELTATFWPGREPRAYAFKSIADAGVPLKMGSDCPVTRLDPWEALACAITRAGPGQTSSFCPEQCLPLPDAYAASTHSGRTHVVVGDRADLVVLPCDPLAADAAGLRAMAPSGTMLGGNWTYQAKTFPY